MIIQENITVGGRNLVKTYSDENKYIIQNETGIKYPQAIDLPNKYTYTEREEEILTNEEMDKYLRHKEVAK